MSGADVLQYRYHTIEELDGVEQPNSNGLEEIREALVGTGIVAKVRIGKSEDELRAVAERLADKRLPLVLEIGYDERNAERNYKLAQELLAKKY